MTKRNVFWIMVLLSVLWSPLVEGIIAMDSRSFHFGEAALLALFIWFLSNIMVGYLQTGSIDFFAYYWPRKTNVEGEKK